METYVNDEVLEQVDSEAKLTAFLSAIYNTNPEADFAQTMEQIAVDEVNDTALKESLQKIKDFSVEAREDGEKLLEMKRDWTRLFRGVSPTYGPQAPYAQEHMGSVSSQFLSDLTELYKEAGYGYYHEFNDRLDYIGIELDFIKTINMLRLKELSAEDSEEYERLTDIHNKFATKYFASWFSSFHKKAQDFVQTDFYRGALDLTLIYAKSFA